MHDSGNLSMWEPSVTYNSIYTRYGNFHLHTQSNNVLQLCDEPLAHSNVTNILDTKFLVCVTVVTVIVVITVTFIVVVSAVAISHLILVNCLKYISQIWNIASP